MAFNHTFQSAAVATGVGTAMDVGGLAAVAVQAEGLTNATLTFQVTQDDSTWYSTQVFNVTDGVVGTTTVNTDGIFLVPVVGINQLRCNITTYVAGTITVTGKGVVSASGLDLGLVDITDDTARLLGRMTFYDVLENGTLTVLNSTVELGCSGLSTVGVGITGTWVGTIVAEGNTGDGVWDTLPLVDQTLNSAALSTTVNGNFSVGVAGVLTLRIRMSLYTNGTATVYLEGTAAPGGVFQTRSLPTGVNAIGKLAANSGVDIGDVDVTSTVAPAGKAGAAGNVHEPAANTAAVVTLAAAGVGISHVLGLAAWSYDGAPTAGSLTIEDGAGTTVFKVDITAAGPGYFPFVPGLKGTANAAMIATLAAGGGGVNGIISVHAWTE